MIAVPMGKYYGYNRRIRVCPKFLQRLGRCNLSRTGVDSDNAIIANYESYCRYAVSRSDVDTVDQLFEMRFQVRLSAASLASASVCASTAVARSASAMTTNKTI